MEHSFKHIENEAAAERVEEEEVSRRNEPMSVHSGGGRRTRELIEPQVLQPDNPLMLRFQAALKAHLIRQRNQLGEEIQGLELDIKQKSKIFSENVEVRELEQQAVYRQNLVLEKEKENIVKLLAEREEIEANLKSECDHCKEVTALLLNKSTKEDELRLEKESLAALVQQFSEWEESQNSEITISHLISDKNRIDKNVHTQEKIYQDLLLVKLTSEVIKLTTKFNELEKNIKQKQLEAESISQAVADGNADLEALERENKKLMRIWNHVILKIQQRDRVMVDVKEQLLESQEHFRRLLSQVESYKRSSATEVKCNEALTQTLARLQGDVEMLERVHTTEEDKQRKLRETLAQVAIMVEFTQRDLNILLADSKDKEAKCNQYQVEADKLTQLKFKFEEEILTKLHHQIVINKAEKQSTKLISELRTNTRKLETQLANAQNEFARVNLHIEHETKLIKERSLLLDEEKLADQVREKELKNLEAGLKRLENTLMKKQNLVDSMNTKIAELLKRNQGDELSQEELEIRSLEKGMAEMADSIEALQSSWMREQSAIVKLTQQRNSLLNQLSVYHKQTLIMRQKHLKIEFEIDNYKKEESNMNRLLHSLENRLTSLNLQCSERKDYKDSLDNQNLISQNQLICDLKDAEVKALTVQEEMCYLEIEKEELRGRIVEAQRELLAWEKKLQLATEVKASIDRAKSEGGEIAVMKSEIHRMEVRYAQLQKVQEKLAHDMEMCISRRDGIVELAQAREKRTTKQAFYTRQQFLKKLDDLQKKINQTNNDLKSVEKSYSAVEIQLKSLTDKKLADNNQLAELQNAVSQMQAQLTEGQLHKQKNLELLVRKQRKARQYGELKAGRYSLMFRQESALELETQKQKSINSDLLSIVESLHSDFPFLETTVTQILNTLRSPAA